MGDSNASPRVKAMTNSLSIAARLDKEAPWRQRSRHRRTRGLGRCNRKAAQTTRPLRYLAEAHVRNEPALLILDLSPKLKTGQAGSNT
jgi:hypothetical protein